MSSEEIQSVMEEIRRLADNIEWMIGRAHYEDAPKAIIYEG